MSVVTVRHGCEKVFLRGEQGLNATNHQSAIWISYLLSNHTNGVGASQPKTACRKVRLIIQCLSCRKNSPFGFRRDNAGGVRVVEHRGYGTGCTSHLPSNIFQRRLAGCFPSALAWSHGEIWIECFTRVSIWQDRSLTTGASSIPENYAGFPTLAGASSSLPQSICPAP